MWQKKVCGPDWVWSGDILEVGNDGRVASSAYTVLAACLVCGQKEGCLRVSQDTFQRSDMIKAPVAGPMWRMGSLGNRRWMLGNILVILKVLSY